MLLSIHNIGLFYTMTIKTLQKKKTLACKHCNSTNTVKVGNQTNGNPKHKCKDCERTWTVNQYTKKPDLKQTCVECESKNAVRSGCQSNGKPRFKCKDCGTSWTKGMTKEKRQESRKYLTTECFACGSTQIPFRRGLCHTCYQNKYYKEHYGKGRLDVHTNAES
jgi:transposase-like protein